MYGTARGGWEVSAEGGGRDAKCGSDSQQADYSDHVPVSFCASFTTGLVLKGKIKLSLLNIEQGSSVLKKRLQHKQHFRLQSKQFLKICDKILY